MFTPFIVLFILSIPILFLTLDQSKLRKDTTELVTKLTAKIYTHQALAFDESKREMDLIRKHNRESNEELKKNIKFVADEVMYLKQMIQDNKEQTKNIITKSKGKRK